MERARRRRSGSGPRRTPRGSRRRAAAFTTILVSAILVSCGGPVTPDDTGPTTPRVGTTATGLTLDHQDWFPSGFNAYQLGTDWSVNGGCGAEVDLDGYFAKLPRRALTRFNLYSAFVASKHTGMHDFGPLDRVLAAAKRHGQMVLPVLAGGSGECEDGVFKQRDWYAGGWRTHNGPGALTFEQWLTAAVTRWRGESAIAGWELVGEPESPVCGDAACTAARRTCPADAADVLRSFFDDAGALLRQLDPRRPVFAGFTGGDQCGTVGSDYAKVGASEFIDVLDFHEYSIDDPRRVPPAGSDLTARLAIARELRKPLVINEIGINAGSCLSLDRRATDIGSAITAQRAAGIAGALLWAFVPDPRIRECTYDLGPDDPVWRVVADIAG